MHPLNILTSSLIGADWQGHSKCLNHLEDADGDHPYDLSLGKYKRDDKDELAQDLCAGCPVIRECAQYALSIRATGVVMAGVWIGANSIVNHEANQRLNTIARTPAQETA